MTSLIISDRNNIPLHWGRFGQDIYSYPNARDTWIRKSVMNGGFFDGYLHLPPDQDIVEFFNNGLGYGIVESDGSRTLWEGFVYEMVMNGNVDRIKSYDTIFNSIAAQSKNYLNNGGFETGTLTKWFTTTTGGGTMTVESDLSLVGRGLYSAKVTAGGQATADKIWQRFDCQSQTTYRLTFFHSGGTADTAARYKILDDIGTIIPTITVESAGGRYRRETVDFITHYNATYVQLNLYVPTNNTYIVYYDDVRIERLVGDHPVSAITSVVENDESVLTYGRKSKVLSRFPELQDAETARDTFLSYNAFPVLERGSISFSEPSLDIYVRGYIETLSWNLWTLQTGGHKQTPQTILEHIRDNNEFIDSILVEGSPDSVFCPDPFLVTQEHAVKSLMSQLGDTWKIAMKANKQLVLEPLSFTPKYYMRNGLLYNDATTSLVGINEVNDRNIEPAIVRDLDSLLTGTELDSGYEDRRDFIMASVEVSADNTSFGSKNIGKIIPSTNSDTVEDNGIFN